MKTRRGFLAAAGGLFSGLALPSAGQAWGFRRRQVVCPPAPVCAPQPVSPCRSKDGNCYMWLGPQYFYGQFGSVRYYECGICDSCLFIADGCSEQSLNCPFDCNNCSACSETTCICGGDSSGWETHSPHKRLYRSMIPTWTLADGGTSSGVSAAGQNVFSANSNGDYTVVPDFPDDGVLYYNPPGGGNTVVGVRVGTFTISSNSNPQASRVVRVGIELDATPNGSAPNSTGYHIPGRGKCHHAVIKNGTADVYEVLRKK